MGLEGDHPPTCHRIVRVDASAFSDATPGWVLKTKRKWEASRSKKLSDAHLDLVRT
jgi:hypothetical protein